MTFKGKHVRVTLIDDAKDAYDELNEIVGEELAKGIKSSKSMTLLKAINAKVEYLKINPQFGTHIKKDLIPSEYIKDYEVNNAWKINLPNAWRMIYSIKGSDVEIHTIILDIFDHPAYENKFGYKKN